MLDKLKSGFKRIINLSRYQTKTSTDKPNQYLDNLIDLSFQGVNRLFVFSFENNAHWTTSSLYFFPAVERKDYNVMTDGKNFFDERVKNNLKTYDIIQKIALCQGDNYKTGCLLE